MATSKSFLAKEWKKTVMMPREFCFKSQTNGMLQEVFS